LIYIISRKDTSMLDLDEVDKCSPERSDDNPPATTLAVPKSAQSHEPAWVNFGFEPAVEAGAYLLPPDTIAFEAQGIDQQAALNGFLQAMELPPSLSIKLGDRLQALFRVSHASFIATIARSIPEGIRLCGAGEPIMLPNREVWRPQDQHAQGVADLSVLTAIEVGRVAAPVSVTEAAAAPNPLRAYSLRGESADFLLRATEAKPLLADLCLSGQVTVWYAAPNTGKTLIALNLLTDAVTERRIDPDRVYYINADDGSEGMANKLQLMDDLGVHTLTPGFKDFTPNQLAPKLHQMAQRDEAKGVFVLVDTAKKFADLMDKKHSAAFGTACRQVAMHGGAVLSLAHTTKAPNADGSPRFSGTTDVVEDADAAYTIQLLNDDTATGERTVEFRCFKRRGDNAMSAAYAYAGENGLGYAERLSSVRAVDPQAVDEFKRQEAERTDEELIQVIASCILDGIAVKMPLGREAAIRSGVSTRHAYKVIERYTGTDPAQHRWNFSRQAHGKQVFALLLPDG
jgi:hypothetical protein